MKKELRIEENKLLSIYSTFGIGGPARYFIEARTVEDVKWAIEFAKDKNLPYLALGKGSNCLFDDKGVNGVVVYQKMDNMKEISKGLFKASASYSFSLLGSQTARQGWAGLEFASGIPGSVGGAVYMNAGANGSETCDTLFSVEYLEENGTISTFFKDQLIFSYRASPFQKRRGIILSATFQLFPSNEARQKQLGIIAYRTKTQPYGEKSAGCIFKNPPYAYAGALIEQCGLKGCTIGGAQVSSVHGNFIINTGNATAKDVFALIQKIKNDIFEKTAIHLENEVRFISFDLSTS